MELPASLVASDLNTVFLSLIISIGFRLGEKGWLKLGPFLLVSIVRGRLT